MNVSGTHNEALAEIRHWMPHKTQASSMIDLKRIFESYLCDSHIDVNMHMWRGTMRIKLTWPVGIVVHTTVVYSCWISAHSGFGALTSIAQIHHTCIEVTIE